MPVAASQKQGRSEHRTIIHLAATALALKRVLAWEFQQAMEKANVSQAEMARRMRTSRAVIRRLLDEDDPSITLSTISKAANALGKNLRLKLAA